MRRLLLALLVTLPAPASAGDLLATLKAEGYATFAGWIEGLHYNYQLAEKGPFTVLAPSDAAIAAQLTPDEIAALAAPENAARLWAILTYHVWPGRYEVGELADYHVVHSMSGYAVTVFDFPAGLQLNNARVLGEALPADNGNIIPIDKVFVQAAP